MATTSGKLTAAAAAAAATKDGGGGGDLTFRPSCAEKMELEKEARSQRNNLTSSDRHLLKAFFSYVPVRNGNEVTNATRTKSDAITYVQTALWPSGLTQEQRDREESAFMPEKLMQPAVPSVFVHTVESLRALFQDGSRMNDIQQGRLVRMFQHFDRLFTRDLAVRTNGFARVFVSGSVRTTVVEKEKRAKKDKMFTIHTRTFARSRKEIRQRNFEKIIRRVFFSFYFVSFVFSFQPLFFVLFLFYEKIKIKNNPEKKR